MAGILAKPALFSNVAVFRDQPHPDSTDLALLVSLADFRTAIEGPQPTYVVIVGVLLVESLGGQTLYQNTITKEFQSRYPSLVPADLAPSAELERVFPVIAAQVLRELDEALKQYSQTRTSRLDTPAIVTHGDLETLRILPVIVESSVGGLASYSRYVDESLRERLKRKNCFTLIEPADSMSDCLQNSFTLNAARPLQSLESCRVSSFWRGLVLVNWISSREDSIQIKSLLVTVPAGEVLVSDSVMTVGGWRLGNTLERLAAGIAQAAHTPRN
jgi:hypothetical protein